MPGFHIGAVVEGIEPREALRRVADYGRWPAASEAIRSVDVEEEGDGVSTSTWEVTFRGGLMRWIERDRLDLDRLRQHFTLVEGDPHDFDGAWTAAPHADGCRLELSAQFDLGMPSLRHLLDPIAIEALEDAIADVLHALFDGRVQLDLPASAPLAAEA